MPVLDGQDMPTCEGLLCLPCLALLLLTGIARGSYVPILHASMSARRLERTRESPPESMRGHLGRDVRNLTFFSSPTAFSRSLISLFFPPETETSLVWLPRPEAASRRFRLPGFSPFQPGFPPQNTTPPKPNLLLCSFSASLPPVSLEPVAYRHAVSTCCDSMRGCHHHP